MSFEWPLQKIDLINSALSQTGDNLVTSADNGSDEWNTCSPAYERALAAMVEAHPWSWVSDQRILPPASNLPNSDQFDTAYNLPADLVHLIYVTVNDRSCIWDLQNDQLLVNSRGQCLPGNTAGLSLILTPAPGWTIVSQSGAVIQSSSVSPATVKIKGVFSTNSDPTFATPMFIVALQAYVMAGIYRGLHEDANEARAMEKTGATMLADAKARHDMQKPKRSMFNSRITASRRIRRPWPPVPGGWSGTGTPG